MKLGIVGKGGVGKTTTSTLIAQTYVARGLRVLAVDTDSNPNLALSLGLDPATADHLPLLPRALVVGAGNGAMSPSDLLERYAVDTPTGVTLLNAMAVTQAGAGCTCTSHATVRSLLGAAIEEETDICLVDMEAGLEHLSRAGGTLAYADVLLVIMEPTRKSILTAARTIALARELGIPRVFGVGNKAELPKDQAFFEEVAAEYGVPLAGVIPHDADVVKADRTSHVLPPSSAPAVRAAIEDILDFVDKELAGQAPNQAERQALLREKERVETRLVELGARPTPHPTV
ncbi:MAG: AAA family ATPase [Acidimicrobiales bacterium]